MKIVIRPLREKKGLTQAELAKRVGVTPSWMNKIENGKVDVKITMAAKIAKALDCSIDDIFRY